MYKLLKLFTAAAVLALLITVSIGTVCAEGTGVVTASLLNVREAPSTDANIVTQLYEGTQVEVLDKSDGWYNINCDGTVGWVLGDYLSVDGSSTQSATITGSGVNLRTGPGRDYDVVTQMYYGEIVTLLGRSDGWFNVQRSDGTTGWVSDQYASIGNSSRATSLGQQIVDTAYRYLGVPYVYGGTSPSGFDCSGLVKYVYTNIYGIWVDRVAAGQAGGGVYVDMSSLRPGDLVFFDTNGGYDYINHVGIYVGNGSFIHSSSGSGCVVTSSIWDGFYSSSYMTARRYAR